MKILYLIDPCSNDIDNSYQRKIINRLALSSSLEDDVQVISTDEISTASAVDLLLDQQYDVYFTYNRSGTDLSFTRNGIKTNLMRAISKPHVCWLTEHPLCWYEKYHQSQNHRHYVLPRSSHATFLKEMDLRGSHHSQLFAADPKPNLKLHRHRTYDVCIAAQWRGSEKANEFWADRGNLAEQFFQAVSFAQISNAERDTYAAYRDLARAMNIDITDKIRNSQYMRGLYWYARKKERIDLVQNFVKSGLKIAIVGSQEWKSVLPKFSNVEFHENCSHDKLLTIYSDSRAVVNLNAANGACERAFDAASVGAMLISEYSPEIEHIFGAKDAVIMYNSELNDMSISIISELIRSNASEALGNNAYYCLSEGHTWGHRGEFLRTIFESLV